MRSKPKLIRVSSPSEQTQPEGKGRFIVSVLGEGVWAGDEEAGVTCRAWHWQQGRQQRTCTRLTDDTVEVHFLYSRNPQKRREREGG